MKIKEDPIVRDLETQEMILMIKIISKKLIVTPDMKMERRKITEEEEVEE